MKIEQTTQLCELIRQDLRSYFLISMTDAQSDTNTGTVQNVQTRKLYEFRVNITFYNNEATFNMLGLVPSPEWTIEKSWAQHKEWRYPCCQEPFPDISFFVRIRRSPIFYTYILIFPCFLLSSLTLVVFWLPPESPAKMVLGMNIFVAFFLMLLLLQDFTPSASKDFSLIGTYYCVNMGIITLSTFLSCIIVNFHFRGDNRQEVPYWLKKLAFEFGGRFLCINFGSSLIQKSENFEANGDEESEESTVPANRPIHKRSEPPVSVSHQHQQPQTSQLLGGGGTANVTFQCSLTPQRPNHSGSSLLLPPASPALSWTRFAVQDDSKTNGVEPAQIFPGEMANSELYRRLESYSPLHSPILRERMHFIDECPQQQQQLLGNHIDPQQKSDAAVVSPPSSNRDSFPLLQDAVLHSLSQVREFQASVSGSLLLPPPSPTPTPPQRGSPQPSLEHQLLQCIAARYDLHPPSAAAAPSTPKVPRASAEKMRRICLNVRVIVKSLKYIHKLQDNKENVARIFSEWRCVGLVLDRLFFYCYIFTIVFSIIMYFPKTNDDPQ